MLKYKNIFNLIGFKVTWIGCVMGEIYLSSYVGLIVGTVYLFIFFYLEQNKKRAFNIILIFSIAGYVFDSFLSYFELYKINSDINFLFLPIWFLVLWPSFSSLLVNLFSFLKNYLIASILFGCIFGPLSYYAGIVLGLVTLINYESFILMSLFWGLLMFCYCNYILNKKLL
jgi:hypothetical protein